MTRTREAVLVLFCAVAPLAAACDDSGDDAEGDGGTDGDAGGDSGGDSGGDTDGDCPSLADGDTDISGFLGLDAYFASVLEARADIAAARAATEAFVESEIANWAVDVDPGAALDDRIAALKAEIEASFEAHLSDGLTVEYGAPVCSTAGPQISSLMFACEEQAGCEVVDPMPGEVFGFACAGVCRGTCDDATSGDCVFDLSGETCEGDCTGSCETAEPADCMGACDGVCTGSCDGEAIDGACDGQCCGECTGACDHVAPFACAEMCDGTCSAELGAGEACDGTFVGACDGLCEAGCTGDATPASGDASGTCAATEVCGRALTGLGRARVLCGTAAIRVCYMFEASVDSEAASAFSAKLEVLRADTEALATSHAALSDLVEGSSDDGVAAGLQTIGGTASALASWLGTGDYADLIDPARLPCVVQALSDAVDIMTDTVDGAMAVMDEQDILLDLFGI